MPKDSNRRSSHHRAFFLEASAFSLFGSDDSLGTLKRKGRCWLGSMPLVPHGEMPTLTKADDVWRGVIGVAILARLHFG
jgi:hypothetical protein